MPALILKSKNALNSDVQSLDFVAYKSRVLADGGYIADEQAVKDTLAFIANNNITEAMAFSVTSPRWGLKLANGKPSKLYSLFGGNGDIDIVVSIASAIGLTTTSGFNTIALKGSSTNALLSGSVRGVNNAGICVVAKPPTLAGASAYGITNGFTLGDLSNLSDATSIADRKSKQIATLLYLRSDGTKMPVDWDFRCLAFGETGALNETTSSTTSWSSEALFVDSAGMVIYNSGVQTGVDNVVTPPAYKDNIQFNIGRSPNTSSQTLAYINPLYADIAEAWCLVNTTSAIMQAISLRASQKYA